MRSIERFEEAMLPAILDLWNRFYPARYAIDERVLRLNTVEAPTFDWGTSCVAFSGDRAVAAVLIKKSSAPLYRSDPDLAHLSGLAFSEVDAAVDLLADSKAMLRDRGISTLVFGTDSRHFFPGVPDDVPILNSFLTVEGFEIEGEVVDLERDLGDYVNPRPIPEGIAIRPIEESEVPRLREFLQKEFPGRWTHDVTEKVSVEGAANTAIGAWDGSTLRGFAMIQQEGHRAPVCGAVWNSSLGANWGSLGPIGVAADERGRGVGHALLGGALEILRDRGARQSIIDWTTLIEFYGAHGFVPTRRYRSGRLVL